MRELANKSIDFTQVLPILVRESGKNPDAAVAYKELYREFAGLKNQVLIWLQESGCCNHLKGNKGMAEQILGRFVTTEASKGGLVITRHITEVLQFTNKFIVVLMQPSGEQNLNLADNDEWYLRVEGFQPNTPYSLTWYVGGTPFTGSTITTNPEGVADVTGRIADLVASGLPAPAEGGSMLSVQLGDYRSEPVMYVDSNNQPPLPGIVGAALLATPWIDEMREHFGAAAFYPTVARVDDVGGVLTMTFRNGNTLTEAGFRANGWEQNGATAGITAV